MQVVREACAEAVCTYDTPAQVSQQRLHEARYTFKKKIGIKQIRVPIICIGIYIHMGYFVMYISYIYIYTYYIYITQMHRERERERHTHTHINIHIYIYYITYMYTCMHTYKCSHTHANAGNYWSVTYADVC